MNNAENSLLRAATANHVPENEALHAESPSRETHNPFAASNSADIDFGKTEPAKVVEPKIEASSTSAPEVNVVGTRKTHIAAAGIAALLACGGGLYAYSKTGTPQLAPIVQQAPAKFSQPVPVDMPMPVSAPAPSNGEKGNMTMLVEAQGRNIERLDGLDGRIKAMEAIVANLNGLQNRLTNLEGTIANLNTQVSGTAAVAADVADAKQSVEQMKTVVTGLAGNIDQRFGEIDARMEKTRRAADAWTPPKHESLAATVKSAMPVVPAAGRSKTIGTTTGSPARALIANPAAASQYHVGDTLTGYGTISEVRPSAGGWLIITESGSLFVKK